ncbi:hypothetical protein MRB53_040314 [Persea americana]|nr:hypothetical protein MRB53_040314 [Persea americana]
MLLGGVGGGWGTGDVGDAAGVAPGRCGVTVSSARAMGAAVYCDCDLRPATHIPSAGRRRRGGWQRAAEGRGGAQSVPVPGERVGDEGGRRVRVASH